MSSKRTTKTTTTKTKKKSAPAKRTTKTTKTTRTKARRNRGGARNSRAARSGHSRPNRMSQLIRSLSDPFHCAPPLVGCGTNIPLTQATLFSRTVISVPTASNLLLVARGGNLNMVTTYLQATGGAAWSAGTVVSFSSANVNSISSRFQSGRVITGGIKARCFAAATSAPPLIMGGLIYDNLTNISGAVPNSMGVEQQLQVSNSLANGIEVLYRTSDLTDYALVGNVTNSSATYANSTIIPYLVIYITNPTGAAMNVFFDTLFHIEGNSGMDLSGDDTDESMAADGFTLEQVNRAGISAGPTVTDRLSTTGLMDSLVNHMASGPRGMSLRSEGGLWRPNVSLETSPPSPYLQVDEQKSSTTEAEPNANIVLSRSLYNVLTRK
jgi:hypothetical protein